jgi:hypothetical protein
MQIFQRSSAEVGEPGSIAAIEDGQNHAPPPSKPHKPRTFTEMTSQYKARFRKDDDQTKVTESEREARKQTAAETADECALLSPSRSLHLSLTILSP